MYSLILAILVAAIVIVGVLLLRKRQILLAPRIGGTPSQVAAPSDTKPLESYEVEREWKEGDPVPTAEELNEGLIE